jgi:ABC-type multidrug transport system ATPase subunit
MLEDDGLYGNMSLFENIKYYLSLYNVDYDKIKSELTDMLKLFELYNVKDNKIASFSKGMKRKTSFIRAILHQPKLLILDEPFNGLDPAMQQIMRDKLLRMVRQRGTTVFISSHNLYEVERICDDIAIIKNGRIKIEGGLDRLLSENYSNLEGLYLELCKD